MSSKTRRCYQHAYRALVKVILHPESIWHVKKFKYKFRLLFRDEDSFWSTATFACKAVCCDNCLIRFKCLTSVNPIIEASDYGMGYSLNWGHYPAIMAREVKCKLNCRRGLKLLERSGVRTGKYPYPRINCTEDGQEFLEEGPP